MTHDWIVEVLDDMTRYTRDNGLEKLAQCLEDASATTRDILAPTYVYCILPSLPPPPREAGPACPEEGQVGQILTFEMRGKK